MKLSSYLQNNRKLSDCVFKHNKQRLSLISSKTHLGKFLRVKSFYMHLNSSPQGYISFKQIVYPAGYATIKRIHDMRGPIPLLSYENLPRRTLSGFSHCKIPLHERGFLSNDRI